jgi:uncharacterized glyoxalase superfamily protein PhnB
MSGTRATGVSPILPVRDLGLAQAHYRSLGFHVTGYAEGDDYAFAERNDVSLHLTFQPTSYYPDGAFVVIYLYVEDADALYQEWSKAGVAGETQPPAPMPWRMNEGTHTDPDGNVIRYGSPIRMAHE